jgi:hypothetical protein
MFRRRPLRRAAPFRTRRAIPRALVHANQVFEAGDYAEAAARFEAIAGAAESREGPRAPQFYFQAGRAYLLDGQTEAGLSRLEHGLDLLAGSGEVERLHRAGRRILSELEERGMVSEAGRITAWLSSNLPEGLNKSEVRPARRIALPTHCPSCGAGVRSDEVDWLDESTVECAYCGSPVRGESN